MGAWMPRLALAGLPLLTGCLDVDFARVVQLREPAVDPDTFVVGRTEMQEALDALGAPLLVYEVGLDVALVWGWYRGSSWGVQVSVPVGDESGSVSYQDTDARVRGLLLLFDRDLVLVSARTGILRDLQRSIQRQRPQPTQLLRPTGASDGAAGADGQP